MTPSKMSCSPVHHTAVDITGNEFYPRYLAAKKSIDDRALNKHVWETLRRTLAQATGREPLRVLEIGAGIGTMLQRVLEKELLGGPITYIATDSDPGQLRAARSHLSQWARIQGHNLSWSGKNLGRVQTRGADVSLVLTPSSAEELAERADAPDRVHLLMAHAVLDLVDFSVLLPRLFMRIRPGGLAYLTCNFDGETVFLPPWDGEQEIFRCYHASMDARLAGASRTGRRLLGFLQRTGLELPASGRSDWVIHPRPDGYGPDEVFFLHTMIGTIERQLARNGNPPAGLAEWSGLRHQQVEDGELSFTARHMDFLVRRRPIP